MNDYTLADIIFCPLVWAPLLLAIIGFVAAFTKGYSLVGALFAAVLLPLFGFFVAMIIGVLLMR
jgi:hypothetical protein|tara:strand:- start:208 stop:399 length:192 start_codon:yes stop_codon:yes gene_type:complete